MSGAEKLDRVIGLSVVTGKGEWGETLTKVAGFGIDGDLDEYGQQRWFESMEAIMEFHPDIRRFSNRIDASGMVCSEGSGQ